MHFAKALERTFCLESITWTSLAIPRFAQPIDPPGLEPVPVTQNEFVFLIGFSAAGVPALWRAIESAQVSASLQQRAAPTIGFRQTARLRGVAARSEIIRNRAHGRLNLPGVFRSAEPIA